MIENEEKKNLEKLEEDYSNANASSNDSNLYSLSSFVQSHLSSSNYKKIEIILLFLLISAEYTLENILLFIPRLISYNISKNNDKYNYFIIIFVPIIIAFSFFISFFSQILNLENKILRRNRLTNIKIIQIILILLNSSFAFIIFKRKIINEYFSFIYLPTGGIFFMIILNEVYRVVIINLFINLLPSKEIYFCGFNLSVVINFITKITTITPALIIFIYKFFTLDEFYCILLIDNDSDNLNFCDIILFGIQIFNLVFCFFLVLFSSHTLKIDFRNRLLSFKEKNKRKENLIINNY